MATEPLNLLVDCLICGKDKVDRNPRQLPCMHSFCEDCLSKTSCIHTEDKLQCPVCLQTTQSSITDLPMDTTSKVIRRGVNMVRDLNVCRLCALKGDKGIAVARCSECEFCLCQTCLEIHKANTASSGHTVLDDVCKIHIRDLSHACITCRTGLCFECLISEFHKDHDTCDITEAQEKMVHLMTQAKHALKQETDDLDKQMNQTIDDSMSFLRQRRKETEDKLEQYRKKMLESLRQYMDKRDEKYHRAVMSALSKQNEVCTQASNCLNEINILTKCGKRAMLTKLVQQTSDIFKSLEAIRKRKHVAISVPHLTDDSCASTENIDDGKFVLSCTIGSVVHYPELFKCKPSKRLCLNELDEAIDSLTYIKAMPDGAAVLGLYAFDRGVKIDVNGEVKMRYSTKAGGNIRGIDVYDDYLYVGTDKGKTIVRVSGSGEHPIFLDPPLGNLCDMAIDGNDLILSDKICLWRYSFDGKRSSKISVGRAWRISIGSHPNIGKVYLVSDDQKCQLRVFRPDGVLLRTIGQKGKEDKDFSCVRGSSMLPNGNILVADAGLHRVSEFGYDGNFIQHLLTQEDGIEAPYDVSFEHPFLWIACWNKLVLFTYDD